MSSLRGFGPPSNFTGMLLVTASKVLSAADVDAMLHFSHDAVAADAKRRRYSFDSRDDIAYTHATRDMPSRRRHAGIYYIMT